MTQINDREDVETILKEWWTGAGNVPPLPGDPWAVPVGTSTLGDIYVGQWFGFPVPRVPPKIIFEDIRKNHGGDVFLRALRAHIGL